MVPCHGTKPGRPQAFHTVHNKMNVSQVKLLSSTLLNSFDTFNFTGVLATMGIRAKAADRSVYPLDMDGIELRCHMIQPTRTLLGAPGIATRSKDGAPGLTTRSKNALVT